MNSRFENAKSQCVEGLAHIKLYDAAKNGKFQLYFSCGLLINNAIERSVVNKDGSKNDIFSIWNLYSDRRGSDNSLDEKKFLEIVAQYTQVGLVDYLDEFINNKLESPVKFIADHLEN